MSKEHDQGRLRVEAWEIEVTKGIAARFRAGDEEFEAELLERLLELKSEGHKEAKEWRSFLASSIYNAAKDLLRYREIRQSRMQSLDACEEDDSSLLDRILPAPDDASDVGLGMAVEKLSPELKTLWRLLVEEEGSITAVSKRLKRPRKTVEYWIEKKLRTFFEKHGLIKP